MSVSVRRRARRERERGRGENRQAASLELAAIYLGVLYLKRKNAGFDERRTAQHSPGREGMGRQPRDLACADGAGGAGAEGDGVGLVGAPGARPAVVGGAAGAAAEVLAVVPGGALSRDRRRVSDGKSRGRGHTAPAHISGEGRKPSCQRQWRRRRCRRRATSSTRGSRTDGRLGTASRSRASDCLPPASRGRAGASHHRAWRGAAHQTPASARARTGTPTPGL